MTKKLIAIDLDGTLLDVKGRYSPATGAYLRRLSNEGHEIVLASGRPFRSMKKIYDDLQLHSPVICYNGALVFHPADASFIPLKRSFNASTIRDLVHKTKAIVSSYMAESFDNIYINVEDDRLDRYFPYADMKIIRGDLEQTLKEDVYTCLFNCPIEKMGELRAACEPIPGIGWRSWSNNTHSELFIPGSDKGAALRYVMEALGIVKEDAYAFGDAENDISMLDASGHPFAMKENKVPSLLSRFPHTKNSVDEDGVMVALMEEFGR